MARTPAPADPPKPAPVDPGIYIQTGLVRDDLRSLSLRSGLISVAAQPVKVVLGMGSAMVLARLLAPSEFGLVAMVMPLLVLIQAAQNFGIETATVYQEGVNHRQVSALFWIALGVNVVLAVLMGLAAPVLAWFYGEPELVSVTLVLALSFLGASVASQHVSLLKRQMQFHTIRGIQVTALALSLGVAIGAAFLGAGYWALVVQLVVNDLLKSVAFWIACKWHPASFLEVRGAIDATIREMLTYGAHLTGSRFVSRVGKQLDRIVVGYLGGPAVLGLYANASRWARFPFDQVYDPLYDVAISSLSRVQTHPERYRQHARLVLLPVFALPLPALVYIFLKTEHVILILLGDQWLEATPLLRVMCIAVFADSLTRVTKWLYVSVGDTKRQFRWGFIYTATLIAAVFIGAPHGAYGVAVAYAVALSLLTVPSLLYCLHTSPLRLVDVVGIVWRPFVAAVCAGGILYVFLLRLPESESAMIGVLSTLPLFLIAYLACWVALPGGRAASREVLSVLRELTSQWMSTQSKPAQPPPSRAVPEAPGQDDETGISTVQEPSSL